MLTDVEQSGPAVVVAIRADSRRGFRGNFTLLGWSSEGQSRQSESRKDELHVE